MLAALRLDSGPPGFYVLEKPFAALAERSGDAGWLLRLPSFAAALAILAATRTLPRGVCRRVFVGLASCALLLTLYAAEARPYALLGLFGLAAFLLTLTGDETPSRLVAGAAAAAAALYCHYLAIFSVGALVLLALAARRFRSAVALAAGAAVFVPWLPVLRGQPPEATGWMRESVSGSVAGFLSALGGVGRVPGPFGGPPPTAIFLAGVAAGIVLLGAAAHVAVARGDAEVRRALVFTVLVLGGALCAGAWRPVAFAGRSEMAVLPVWIWGVARAAGESRTSRGGGTAAALFGVAATCAVVLRPAAIPAGDVTAALLATARPADVVVAAGGFYLPLRLEAERGRLPARVRALPREIEAHPGWFVPALPADADARAIEQELAGLPEGGRLFLVIPPPYATPALMDSLRASGRVRELARSRDVVVMQQTRNPDSREGPSGPGRSR